MMLDVPPTTAVAIEFVCLFISLIFVFLRIYVHARILGRLTLQDALIVFAWPWFMARVVCDYYLFVWDFWNPGIQYTTYSWPDFEKYVAKENLAKGFKVQYYGGPFYYFSVYSIKASFFLLFLETFPKSMVTLRRVLYFAIVFNAVGLVVVILVGMLWCLPVRRNWSLDPLYRCLSWSHLEPYFLCTAFNIVSDLSVYILPFFLLPTLYRTASRKKFIGIVVVFSFGLLSVICMICKTSMVGLAARPDLVEIWTAAEMACALIAACLPPLKRLSKVTIRSHLGRGSLSNSTPRSGSAGRKHSKGAEIVVSKEPEDGMEMDDQRNHRSSRSRPSKSSGGMGGGQSSNSHGGSVRSALNLKNIFRGTLATGSGGGKTDIETAGTGWTTDVGNSVIRTRMDHYDTERDADDDDDMVMGGLAPPRKIPEPKPAYSTTSPKKSPDVAASISLTDLSGSTSSRSRDNSSERRRVRTDTGITGSTFWNKWRSKTSSSSSSSKTPRKKRIKDPGLPNLTFGSSKNRTNRTISQIDEEPNSSFLRASPRSLAADANSLDPMLGSTREGMSSHSHLDSERGRVMTMPAHQRRSVSPGFGFLSGSASPTNARDLSVRTSSSLEGSFAADTLSIEPVNDKINRHSFGSIFGPPP